MIEVSSDQLQLWVVSFLWPFCRIGAFLMASPLLGHSSIPVRVKVCLAAMLSILLAPNLPPLPQVPVFSWAGVGIIVEQFLIGMAIGMTMRVVFGVVEFAGEIIGLQMGLGFATFYAPDTASNTMVLSRLLYMLTLLMFLVFDAHLLVLELLAGTFTSLPIGGVRFDPAAWQMLARYGSTIFLTGLLLALPLVASLLIINLAMGILNRAAPQLTVFSVGFPLTLTIGLVLLMELMTDLGRFLEGLFRDGLQFLEQLVASMGLPG